jgi:CheY-like chemotaxis protein
MQPPIVLIVDDDSDFRSILAEVLREEGYRIVEATNGEEAIHVLDSLTPDLILADLIMPVVNGWSLFARIQARPELRDVPVAFLSAVPQMAPGGGSLVLKKPLDLPSLLTLLDAVRPEPRSNEIPLKAAPRTAAAYRLRDPKRRN